MATSSFKTSFVFSKEDNKNVRKSLENFQKNGPFKYKAPSYVTIKYNDENWNKVLTYAKEHPAK